MNQTAPSTTMTPEAKKARKEYYAAWRKRNPDASKRYQVAYFTKLAEQQKGKPA